MSHILRRAALAALVATVAGFSMADAAFAQGKGQGGGHGGYSRGGGGNEGGTEAAFDIYGAKVGKYAAHQPPTYHRKPRRWRQTREVSCEVDADLEVFNSADRRKCNLPTKRIRQAYVSCQTVYVAVPGGYIPERVCTRGE